MATLWTQELCQVRFKEVPAPAQQRLNHLLERHSNRQKRFVTKTWKWTTKFFKLFPLTKPLAMCSYLSRKPQLGEVWEKIYETNTVKVIRVLSILGCVCGPHLPKILWGSLHSLLKMLILFPSSWSLNKLLYFTIISWFSFLWEKDYRPRKAWERFRSGFNFLVKSDSLLQPEFHNSQRNWMAEIISQLKQNKWNTSVFERCLMGIGEIKYLYQKGIQSQLTIIQTFSDT